MLLIKKTFIYNGVSDSYWRIQFLTVNTEINTFSVRVYTQLKTCKYYFILFWYLISDSAAGPIIVWFNSDGAVTGRGFKIDYQQNSCINEAWIMESNNTYLYLHLLLLWLTFLCYRILKCIYNTNNS